MTRRLTAWLRLFRAVNLPTVPGDVFAGVAAAGWLGDGDVVPRAVAGAALAGVLLYMYGLADNDIVGAATDRDRPIPQGLISMRFARIARGACILGAMATAVLVQLPHLWWLPAFFVTLCIVIYNRTKSPLLMGLCRGFNLLCGFAAASPELPRGRTAALALAALWTLYIAGVTKYSEGEETDPARKRRVGLLIGALVWLQLAAIVAFVALHDLPPRGQSLFPLVVAQLAMIALLFLFKRLMPKVSAS